MGGLTDDVLQNFVSIAEQFKEFYQNSFDEISIERDDSGRYLVTTDRYNHVTGEMLRMEVLLQAQGGSPVLIEGEPYALAFKDATVGFLSSFEASELIREVALEWGVVPIDQKRFGLIVVEGRFAEAYGQLLEFMTEIAVSHGLIESIKALRTTN